MVTLPNEWVGTCISVDLNELGRRRRNGGAGRQSWNSHKGETGNERFRLGEKLLAGCTETNNFGLIMVRILSYPRARDCKHSGNGCNFSFHLICNNRPTNDATSTRTRARTKETLTTTTTTAVVNLAHYFSAFLNFCARTRCSSYYTVGVCWFSGCSVWQIDSTMLSLRKDSRVFLDFCSLVVLLHAGREVLSWTGRLEAENVKFPVNNNDFDVGNCGWLVCLPGCNDAII